MVPCTKQTRTKRTKRLSAGYNPRLYWQKRRAHYFIWTTIQVPKGANFGVRSQRMRFSRAISDNLICCKGLFIARNRTTRANEKLFSPSIKTCCGFSLGLAQHVERQPGAICVTIRAKQPAARDTHVCAHALSEMLQNLRYNL